jgi:hypothetical protein
MKNDLRENNIDAHETAETRNASRTGNRRSNCMQCCMRPGTVYIQYDNRRYEHTPLVVGVTAR